MLYGGSAPGSAVGPEGTTSKRGSKIGWFLLLVVIVAIVVVVLLIAQQQ